MNNERRYKPELDETILISLDQLSQTLEVMNQVVCRLKGQVENSTPLPKEPTGHNRRSTDKHLDNKEISQIH